MSSSSSPMKISRWWSPTPFLVPYMVKWQTSGVCFSKQLTDHASTADFIPSSEDEGQPFQVEVASTAESTLDSLPREGSHRPPAESSAQSQISVVTSSTRQDDDSEENFIEYLRQLAQAKALLYDQEDLISFHTALKAGGLVLLSGMSGTGKSRLAHLYGEALGLSHHSIWFSPFSQPGQMTAIFWVS